MPVRQSQDALSRVQILNVGLDRVTHQQVLDRVAAMTRESTPLQIVTVNIQFIVEANRNPVFARAISDAALAVTDGRPLMWVARRLGLAVPCQITGHDLFRDFARFAAHEGRSILLLGGAPGVAKAAAQRLRVKHPGLRVAGLSGGTFSADGVADAADSLAQSIRDFQPFFLFVGLGCPKQDLWLAQNLRRLGVPVGVGVGGVFDVYTGRLPRAPVWVQRAGAESVFQLLVAPRRYAKRYLVDYPPAIVRILLETLWRRLFSSEASG